MTELITAMSAADLLAIFVFFGAWLAFEIINNHTGLKNMSLSGLMAHRRREWMLVMAERDMRMVDTSIIAGLQQGTAFFASSTILAIGGCFALLGSTDMISGIYQDLPLNAKFVRGLFELKVLGLTMIFVYSFFKFGWAFRLFNYCSILIGAVQQPKDAPYEVRRAEALRAAEMNIDASAQFTAGLRAIFFALGYLGWFVSPYAFIATTGFILIVLVRRQYFSKARAILLENSH